MILRRTPVANSTVDQRARAAAAGFIHHHEHSAVLAAAWIDTLHNRAERSAERHLRSA